MGSNFAAREATADDLLKFRSPGQWSRLGLAIQHPATVYTALIDQAEFEDGLAELTYKDGSGTLSDVLEGMTVFIGSSAGAMDKGICRVRKSPTADKLYINQVSDISFADEDHLTVVESISIWPRDMRMVGSIVFIDYDLEFGDYRNRRLLLPRIAPLVSVLHMADAVDGEVTFTPPDPTLSACYNGATVVSYQYDAPGAVTTADMDTSAPSWTYDTAGEYRWSCTITDSNGTETVSHRWVYVDPDKIPFKFQDASGDPSTGDWSLTVTCLAEVAKSQVHDRAMCTLYGTDYYHSTTKGAVGRIAGYENIYLTGWIDLEENDFDSEDGEVTFTIYGPAHWMSKVRALPFELQDVSGAPASWKKITEMNVDKAMAFLLIWTSTVSLVMDCFLTGNTTREKIFTQPSGSLLDQINAIAEKVFATVLVNNYGQMYIETDTQMISSADRNDLPVVMDITKADRLDGLNVRRIPPKTSMIELSGWNYDGTNRSQVFSRAPGSVPKNFGEPDALDDYLIADQDECNRIAGCILAAANGEFDPLEITLSANNRLFDICPRMFATITILAADNPRGIAVASARLIPRKVELVSNEDSSSLLTKVTFEFESVSVDGVTYYPPAVEDVSNDYTLEDTGSFDFPNSDLGTLFPDSIPAPFPAGTCNGNYHNVYATAWNKSELRGESDDRIATIYYPCKVRASSAIYKTELHIAAQFFGDAAAEFSCYGIKGGARILTGTYSNGVVTFAPLTETDVDGFELELNSGLGADVDYVPLEIIDSGSVDANNGSGIDITVPEDGYYAIENTGGPYNTRNGDAGWNVYSFSVNGSGILGLGYLNNENTFYLDTPTGCEGSMQISSKYARTFIYVVGSVNFRVADFIFYDNQNQLGYILRNARVDGRRIIFTSPTLQNVCAPG